MIKIGEYNELEIVKEVDFGLYLDGGPYGEILLPKSYTTEDMKVGNDVNVFLYNDSEDRLIATTKQPKVLCGGYACLKVKEIARVGAFLDWGLDGKDLLVPFREQYQEMEAGNSYVVFVYLDEATNRIVGSAKLSRFFKTLNENFEENDEVEICVAQQEARGYRVIINDSYLGMLYSNQVFKTIKIGQVEKGYIKHIRPDGLIDVSLQRQGYRQQIPDACKIILAKLEQNKGFLPLHDKSAPEDIQAQLAMSKKAFKKAIGYLYKQKMIVLKPKGIQLIK